MATDFHAKGLGSGLKPKSMGGSLGEKKPAAAKEKMGEEPKDEHEGSGIEIHDHGDGTAHTVIDGEKTEHPDHMHAVAHVAHKLMPEAKHFHAKHDGFSGHTHSVGEGGEHSETQEHDSPQEMHGVMDAALGGEGDEPQQQPGAEQQEPSLGGFQG